MVIVFAGFTCDLQSCDTHVLNHIRHSQMLGHLGGWKFAKLKFVLLDDMHSGKIF